MKGSGVSLCELMVALLLASLLLLCVTIILNNASLNDAQQNALALIQEQGSIAQGILSRAIRHSGLLGCQHAVPEHAIVVAGLAYPASLPLTAPGMFQIPSDNTFIVQYALAPGNLVVKPLSRMVLQVDALPVTFKFGNTVAIDNCERTQITRIDGVEQEGERQTLSFSQPLSTITPFTHVSRWQAYQYFIAPAKYPDSKGHVIGALWEKDFLRKKNNELVQGVEDMHILSKSKLITVALLIRSPVYSHAGKQQVRWRNQQITYQDGFLRGVRTFSIRRRNGIE